MRLAQQTEVQTSKHSNVQFSEKNHEIQCQVQSVVTYGRTV